MTNGNEQNESDPAIDAPAQEVPRRNLPSIGRVVHYVLAKGSRRGEHRAAVITGVGSAESGVINITIFFDQSDDYLPEAGKPFGWMDRGWSVPHSTEKTPGTWHWPEIVT